MNNSFQTHPAQGLRALVTGGSSGIGSGIVEGLSAHGVSVDFTGLTAEEIANADAPDTATGHVLDLGDHDAIDALAASFDRLDILVNCAGMIARNAEFEPDMFDRVLQINLSGTMRMCVACRPLLAASNGCIVNTASMLSFFGGPAVPAYTASKGGVAQLTKSLAAAWAADGVRVNAIAPGWIETPLTSELARDEARSRALLDRTPMNRWGRPEDIAGPVVFLCSPAAGFMTGAVIPIDGGYAAV
ncbi:MAG: SDR family oxidoreductase [Alphaproteobacteria bacterium]|nr:SDR family oxidoreductase [Alphaproteobacteria bacterium]